MPARAKRAEALGFDGLIVPEAVQDAILGSLLALEHTERIRVMTGVVVAFARSPMLLAQDAWGLQQLSGGRFELGLGSQIQGNIEKRYGMPWSAPAPRMRDYVGALRAVFECWQNGTPLRYESESYRLTRMQPFFAPEPLDPPGVPIAMGAVGPAMTAVAGEAADAMMSHPTNSGASFLRERTLPAIHKGAARGGRDPEAFRLIASPMTATGATEDAVRAEREAAREVLAFTFSTPAYAASLEHHGWEEVGEALRADIRAGRWGEISGRISDEMLDVLVPSADFGGIVDLLLERYRDLATGVTLRMPADPADDGAFAEVIAALRAG